MKRIFIAILLLLIFIPIVCCGEEQITYQDYGVKFTVPVDARSIDLGKHKVSNFDVFERFLDQLPCLQRVDMYSTHMFSKQAKRLSERFPHIEFGWTLYFGEHCVRTDQLVFSTLHGAGAKRHSSESMDVLRYCRNLRALDLGHNDLTDISFLENLSELRLLILADNRIEDLSPLRQLKNLEYIELFLNRVTGFEPLTNLPHLMDLNVAQNNAECIEPLMRMSGLKRLWICSCTNEEGVLDDQSLQALYAALPETQIDTVSLGTDGGWRSHPHYDVLFQMFKGDQYIPFEDSFDDGSHP